MLQEMIDRIEKLAYFCEMFMRSISPVLVEIYLIAGRDGVKSATPYTSRQHVFYNHLPATSNKAACCETAVFESPPGTESPLCSLYSSRRRLYGKRYSEKPCGLFEERRLSNTECSPPAALVTASVRSEEEEA